MSLQFIDPYTQEKLRLFEDERRERALRLRMSLGLPPAERLQRRHALTAFVRRIARRAECARAACQAPEAAISQ